MARSIEQEIRDLHELFGSSRDPEGLAFVPLADAYRRSGDTTRALVLLTDGRARHPDLPAASLVEALVRRDLGDSEGAEEAFRRVLELDPDNARALVGLGRVLMGRRAEDPEGEALLRRGLSLDPGLEEDEPQAPEPASAPSIDPGLVEPAELAPAGFDGEVAAAGESDVGGEDGGIDLEVPEPPAGEEWSAEELHIEWDSEAAFEPFDGGLYGDVQEFGDAEADEAHADDAQADEAQADDADDDGAVTDEIGSLPTGDVAPEELLMELTDLAPDLEPGVLPSDEDDDEEEVLPTRTLAELYVRQGLTSEAVEVYAELVARSPDDWGLQARLEELRAQLRGGVRAPSGEAVEPAGPSVREFLGRLVAWQPGGEADGSGAG